MNVFFLFWELLAIKLEFRQHVVNYTEKYFLYLYFKYHYLFIYMMAGFESFISGHMSSWVGIAVARSRSRPLNSRAVWINGKKLDATRGQFPSRGLKSKLEIELPLNQLCTNAHQVQEPQPTYFLVPSLTWIAYNSPPTQSTLSFTWKICK